MLRCCICFMSVLQICYLNVAFLNQIFEYFVQLEMDVALSFFPNQHMANKKNFNILSCCKCCFPMLQMLGFYVANTTFECYKL